MKFVYCTVRSQDHRQLYHVTVGVTRDVTSQYIICRVSTYSLLGGMPFPKLLTKVKLWIAVLFLLLLTMFYFYLRFNKVKLDSLDSSSG